MNPEDIELTEEKIETPCGKILHRIRSLREWSEVPYGKLGGFVENLDNLQYNGWVADDAWVYGNAKVAGCVSGNARVFDFAEVGSSCNVCGHATVRGTAKILSLHRYGSLVSGNAEISENAQIVSSRVTDDAHVFGQARVMGSSKIYGSAQVFGNAVVRGHSEVFGNAKVYGYAEISFVKLFGQTAVYDDARLTGGVKTFEISGNSVIHGSTVANCLSLKMLKYHRHTVIFKSDLSEWNDAPPAYTDFRELDHWVDVEVFRPKSLWSKLFRS
jgi:carbonic anhydrase/acetyltransferase-like protein (isoleucine patch superfamily)